MKGKSKASDFSIWVPYTCKGEFKITKFELVESHCVGTKTTTCPSSAVTEILVFCHGLFTVATIEISVSKMLLH